jgi:hypothetical protein
LSLNLLCLLFLQADAFSKLQQERSRLSAIVEQGLSEQAELNTLRQQAGELSGVTHELQQTRQTLLELQAVARQLEQHRVQILSLADQKAELEAALQTQAELQVGTRALALAVVIHRMLLGMLMVCMWPFRCAT